MSESSRIYPTWEAAAADAPQLTTLPDCHWKLCRQFMDRYQNLLSEEQLYALSHIFANTQLLLRGDADQTMQLVLTLVKDRRPVAAEEVDHVEKCCWEKEAEPEFKLPSPVVEIEAMDICASDNEVFVEDEPEEIVDITEEAAADQECSISEIVVDTEVFPTDYKQESGPIVEMNTGQTSEKPKVPEPVTEIIPKVEPITFESVCKNLVLFDDDFYKTQAYYNRLGCGQLEVTVKLGSDRFVTHATIHVKQLILSQVSAKDRSKATKKAISQFFRVTKDQCFKVKTLPPKNALLRTTNLIQRQTRSSGDPLVSIDPGHYWKVMRDFQEHDDGCHLVFSEEFTNLECSVLQGIAAQVRVNCRVFDLPDKSQRFLVLARELPPQEIVRRIVLHQNAILGLQYQVSHPKRKRNGESSSGIVYDPELLSPKRDPPVPSSLNPKQQKSVQFFMRKVKTKPETYDETVANLTVFKPVSTLRSVEDVYRNLVVIESDFQKTAQEFGELMLGSLLVSSKELDDGGFSATVQVRKFVLVEIRSPSGITRKAVKRNVQAAFLKRAKMFCYQITRKQSREVEIHVAKDEDPATNIGHYKRLIKDFWKDSVEQDLVFSAEFTKADREKFHSIAHALNLKSCSDGVEGVNRQLRIVGRRLPALAIVERIVVAKDPKLSALFEVTAPRVGVRQTEEGGGS